MNILTKAKDRLNIVGLFQFLCIAFLLGLSVLIVLRQANPMLTRMGRDSGAFAYIGNAITQGYHPYLDAWDSKPPGIFLVNALGLSLIKGSRWGIWFIEYLFLLTTVIIGFLAMRKHFGVGAAMASSMVWLFGLNKTLGGGNFTEEYSLLFGFLSIMFFIGSIDNKKTLLLDMGIGLCLGISFLFRTNNIGPQITIILTLIILLLLKKEYLPLLKRSATIGVAALIPIGILVIYLFSQNALYAFWEASFSYNLAYSGNHFNPSSALFTGLSVLGFSIGVAVLGISASWIAVGTQIKKQNQADPIALWISLSGIIEVVLSGISGRNYIHYFINWLPFIAISSAYIISISLPTFIEWANKRTTLYLSIMSIILFMSFHFIPGEFIKSVMPLLNHSENFQRMELVPKYLNMKTTPEQTVLVWGGEVAINFLSSRNSPTPYLFYPLYVESEITNRISENFYNRIVSDPPEFIVDGSYNDPHGGLIPLSVSNPEYWLTEHEVYNTPFLIETLKFIQENYVLNNTITGVDLYRLK